jgi:hypothetical protein
MRFTCEIPGFEANWIEIDERWTRREGKELFSLPEIQAFNKYFPKQRRAANRPAENHV